MLTITRSLIRSPVLRQGLQRHQVNSASSINIKIVPAAEAANKEKKGEHPFDRNERLGRNMSPHLSIYKPQLTSMLSITHRGTGVALTVYAWALGLGAIMTSHDISHYATMVQGLHLNPALVAAVKFTLAFPLAYHYVNGIRHLFWDYGKFLKMKEVYSTGYAMLGVSVVLSLILAML